MPEQQQQQDGAIIMADISNGLEAVNVPVVNNIGKEKPEPFTYIVQTEMDPPDLLVPDQNNEPIRCRVRGAFRVFYAGPTKGWALQALELIAEGTRLFEYAGVLTKYGEEDDDDAGAYGAGTKDDNYFFDFSYFGQNYRLDAYARGNLARFVNHSCRPNCCALIGRPDASGIPRVLITALRQIRAGEELSFDYGENWWCAKASDMPNGCQCGESECRYDVAWCSTASSMFNC